VVVVTLAIARGHCAELFEFVEGTFDKIARLAGLAIMRDDRAALGHRRNHRLGPLRRHQGPDGVAVIGAVCQRRQPSGSPANSCSSAGPPQACPVLSISRIGRPSASARAWILAPLGDTGIACRARVQPAPRAIHATGSPPFWGRSPRAGEPGSLSCRSSGYFPCKPLIWCLKCAP